MAYSKNKKIVLIGDTGLLSKELNESLKKQNKSFICISISRKDNIKTKEELYKILRKHLSLINSYILINCLASLKPKNKSDYYINEQLPQDLLTYPTKDSCILIQFSSNNTLINQLKDKYSIQKKNAEAKILEIKNAKYKLIRLPLLLPKKNFYKENIPKQFSLLMRFIDIPYISFVPPSRNIYKPIKIQEVVYFTIATINNYKKNDKNEIININGKKEMNLLEISKLLLSNNKERKNNIFFQIPIPWKILDFFIYNFPNILNLLERNTTLQQLLFIRR